MGKPGVSWFLGAIFTPLYILFHWVNYLTQDTYKHRYFVYILMHVIVRYNFFHYYTSDIRILSVSSTFVGLILHFISEIVQC